MRIELNNKGEIGVVPFLFLFLFFWKGDENRLKWNGYQISLIRYLKIGNFKLCLIPGKYKGKKKNAKENDFLMFGCPMKNIKENQI